MTYRSSILLYLFFYFAVLSSPGCSRKAPQDEIIPGKRIISLSPSITGQIIDLGAEDNLVGVTPYHPPLKKNVPLVGTYISPSIEKIISLQPDIIFMSEEDGEIQRNSFFDKFGLKYHLFGRNSSFKSICDNYLLLGEMINRSESASAKIDYYRKRLESVKKKTPKFKVAFLVSVKPLITVSGRSHISEIISDAGGINVFEDLNNPYPILTMEALIIKKPDVVIIMSPGDDRYFYQQLKNFKSIEFLNRKNIFVAGDEIIPYYSPREYVLSVEKISDILNHANK